MIEIERHIEILLLRNDCVIVPGLGGFLTHHIDAKYDDRDNMFLPPLRTLGFNPKLTMNDSLLAQSYVEAYDISYPEAVKRIEEEINEIRQHIEINGQYELNDIGKLFLNSDGNMEFKPCEAGILTPELYGLDGFEFKKIKDIDNEDETDFIDIDLAEKTPAPIQTKAVAVNKEKTSDDNINNAAKKEVTTPFSSESEPSDNEDDEEPTLKIPIKTLQYITAAAIAIIAFFFLTSPIANSSNGNITMSSVKEGILFNLLTEPKVDKKADIKLVVNKKDTNTVKATNIKNEKVKDADSIKITKKNTADKEDTYPYYSIVLASKVTKSNAEHFVNDLRDKGYSQAKIHIHNKTVRVIYGNFSSEQDAYNALNKLHDKSDVFSEAWVYKVRI